LSIYLKNTALYVANGPQIRVNSEKILVRSQLSKPLDQSGTSSLLGKFAENGTVLKDKIKQTQRTPPPPQKK